jgi:hypothetical protein
MEVTFMGVIVPLSILLPLFFGIYQYNVLTPSAKYILLYVAVSGIINLAATIIAKFYHSNNLPLLHVLTVLELYILVLFYQQLLFSSRIPFMFRLLPLVFLAACVFNAVFFQDIYTYNSYARSLEALIIMLLAINYFAKIAASSQSSKIYALPGFWFNTAVFLYFSGAFMLFIFSNFIVGVSRHNFNIIWNIHAALVLLMYLLFTIGFKQCKK